MTKSSSEGRKCEFPTDHGPCQQPAGARTDHLGWGHCSLHLGNAPNHRVSAELARVQHEARGLLQRLGEPEPAGDPVDVVFRGLDEADAWLSILRELLDQLRELSNFDNFGADRERAVVLLYERALDRRQKYATEIARLDLDTRRLYLQEVRVSAITAAIDRVFTRLGLAESQRLEARRLLASELGHSSVVTTALPRLPDTASDQPVHHELLTDSQMLEPEEGLDE